MDVNAEVSTQLSLIDVLLIDLDKTAIAPCASKKDEKEEEKIQDSMPDSTTNSEKSISNPFHCGDDVLVPNKDGKYYLGTIVELSTSNDNDSCEVGAGVARCLVKFGDGTHSWAAVSSLKLLSAPPADDGCIMCVVCKRREGPAASPHPNAVIACDVCGRGYHAKCHTPPVESWMSGASWHCKRCVDQRYRVAAAENRALKRTDFFRFKGNQRRQQEELTPSCDTASTTSSTASEVGTQQGESHCYCGDKSDWLAQMLLCCRCSRWFHQRCVKSLQYPLYAGDKLYIFSCSECNGGSEYLRRLELGWLELAHLALYNLTAYNAPNYFDLDTVIMPYILDNWHVLQLPEQMWRSPVSERRERILTALTSSRKRFKCGREMKKRATIWGLRLRRPPQPPQQLAALEQIKKGISLTDDLVKEYAPRLRFLPRTAEKHTANSTNDSANGKACISNGDPSSYKAQGQRMIVPVDGNWLNLMMGKRFHENLSSNSNSENDSTSSYESPKPNEKQRAECPTPPPIAITPPPIAITPPPIATTPPPIATTPPPIATTPRKNAKEKNRKSTETTECDITSGTNKNKNKPEEKAVPSKKPIVQCSVNVNILPKEDLTPSNMTDDIEISNHTSITTVNMEVSKLSTKNIIEHSKIMSLHHMDSSGAAAWGSGGGGGGLHPELESSGDDTSSRGTLDAIIPPLKDFQGKNNPFLMQNKYTTSSKNKLKQNGKLNHHSRLSLPGRLCSQTGPLVKPLKRKLSEKDIVIGPNGEVKRRKYRRPKKYLEAQLNRSCPLPNDTLKAVENNTANTVPDKATPHPETVKTHGRRLRQRSEKNYYENARKGNSSSSGNNSSVKSLQLSPHKVNGSTCQVEAEELSALKSSVQSYFRAGQTFQVLARRLSTASTPAYLIQWDS